MEASHPVVHRPAGAVGTARSTGAIPAISLEPLQERLLYVGRRERVQRELLAAQSPRPAKEAGGLPPRQKPASRVASQKAAIASARLMKGRQRLGAFGGQRETQRWIALCRRASTSL